ncbi:hypothetical protein ACRN9F_24705, partial [Shewanella oncorhynchi]|uniref:hypothetical protein n=1 Tax=Shewanella oncorhynchi TaxID=2726434 RepID=UPI003D7A352C
ISKPIVVIFIGGPVLFLMSFSDYIVAHCEADLKWMGPFHYPCLDHATNANALRQLRGEVNFCDLGVGC